MLFSTLYHKPSLM